MLGSPDPLEELELRFPERARVLRFLLEHGMGLNERGEVVCGEVEIPASRIARAVGVDRRTVKAAAISALSDEKLRMLFLSIKPAGPSLKEAARYFGLTVIEISVDDPRRPGILARAASILAEEGVSIRQAIAEDPELTRDPKLTLIVEEELPEAALKRIRRMEGVRRVSIL